MLKLYPYQKIGVDFLVSRKRAGLFDEMGIGKTVQALKAAERFTKMDTADHLRVLVVCPASLRLNWLNEIKMWVRSRSVIVRFRTSIQNGIIQNEYKREVADTQPILFDIVSYNFFQRDANLPSIENRKYDIVIADEIQNCKNWAAKQTQNFVKRVAVKVKRLWVLSGTPATRCASDYHTILSMLEPGKWGKYKDFCFKYCNSIPDNFSPSGWRYSGFKNERELFSHVKKVSLRRRKKDVFTDMPSIVRTDIEVEVEQALVTACQIKDISRINRIINGEEGLDIELATLRRAIGIGKVKAALEWLKEIEVPIVIFCIHLQVIDQITKALKEKGEKVGSIVGGEDEKKLYKTLEAFKDGSIDKLVVSIGAVGVGHNFTKASYGLFVEFPWSPAVLSQAEARLDRIGQQKETVNFYRMVARETIDERVLDVLKSKRTGMNLVLDGNSYA